MKRPKMKWMYCGGCFPGRFGNRGYRRALRRFLARGMRLESSP
jgi:hypothetical protein